MLYVGLVRWDLTLALSDSDTHVHIRVIFVARGGYQITKLNQEGCKRGDKGRRNNYTRLKNLYKILLGKSSTKS